MKTFPAVVVANYFVQKGVDEKRPIDNMKVNKLVYLAHGWHLGFNGNPLIRERVEAWQYGPVVRSVYDAFKEYGKHNIVKQADTGMGTKTDEIKNDADPETIQILDAIWNCYRERSALQLSKLTHEKDSPWDKALKTAGRVGPFGVVIEEKEIEEYYEERIRKNLQKSD